MNQLIFTELNDKNELNFRKTLIDTVKAVVGTDQFRLESKKSTIIPGITILSLVVGSPFIGNEVKYSLTERQYKFLSSYYR